MFTPLSEGMPGSILYQLTGGVAHKSTVLIFIVNPSAAPIRFKLLLVVDNRLNHRDWSRVKGCFRTTKFTNHRVNFGDGLKSHILFLQNINGLANRGMRHRCRHKQE